MLVNWLQPTHNNSSQIDLHEKGASRIGGLSVVGSVTCVSARRPLLSSSRVIVFRMSMRQRKCREY